MTLQRSKKIAVVCITKEQVRMKRHEYSKSILAYLNYELVVIHGINCTVYYVAVRSTRFRLQLLSQKKIHIYISIHLETEMLSVLKPICSIHF